MFDVRERERKKEHIQPFPILHKCNKERFIKGCSTINTTAVIPIIFVVFPMSAVFIFLVCTFIWSLFFCQLHAFYENKLLSYRVEVTKTIWLNYSTQAILVKTHWSVCVPEKKIQWTMPSNSKYTNHAQWNINTKRHKKWSNNNKKDRTKRKQAENIVKKECSVRTENKEVAMEILSKWKSKRGSQPFWCQQLWRRWWEWLQFWCCCCYC